MIQDQINLPLSIAMGVVLRGIKIRFGRSLVTIMGVTLGIAFLMSILTGQIAKRGVGEEDGLRSDVKRMHNSLIAEMGPPTNRTVAVAQIGELNEIERRLLVRLDDEGLGEFRWTRTSTDLARISPRKATIEDVAWEKMGRDTNAVLVVGGGDVPETLWPTLFGNVVDRSIGVTRRANAVEGREATPVIVLERELRPEELVKIEKDKARERFRSVWIIAISLLVTVIGISNAMLMSVTERFREIGTMKCLGALSAFIRRIFLIESSLMGAVGGAAGGVLGTIFSLLIYSATYGPGLVFSSLHVGWLLLHFVFCLIAGIVLSIVAAIYPASVASSMVPADALRTNV